MSKYINLTATGLVKTGFGKLKGIFVASVSGSPTIALHDGIGATPAAAVKATQVLTVTGVFTDGETIVIGNGDNKRTYTMKTTLSTNPVAYQVLIGASAAASLDNLKLAINAGAGAGTNYSTGTLAHPSVTATTNTDTEQTVEAIGAGTAGNAIAVTEACANASWGAATLAGGLEAIVLLINTFIPVAATYYEFPDVDFINGLYYTEGGTVDCTLFFD